MRWQDTVVKQDTQPERICRHLLEELGLTFVSNEMLVSPFRIYPIEADFLVDGCLVIEVQSQYFHTKSRRARKDEAKRRAFEAMGLGVLWLWDDELKRCEQPTYQAVWRPFVLLLIRLMLEHARQLRSLWLAYMNAVPNTPTIDHPDYGLVSIRTRRN